MKERRRKDALPFLIGREACSAYSKEQARRVGDRLKNLHSRTDTNPLVPLWQGHGSEAEDTIMEINKLDR
jgi:hypothetical protein